MPSNPTTSRSYPDLALYRRLFAQSRRYWLHIACILLLSFLLTPLTLLIPIPLKLVVDYVLIGQPAPSYIVRWLPAAAASPTGMVLAAAVLFVVVSLGSQVVSATVSLLATYAGQHLALESRTTLFQHIQRLSLIYHDSKGTHDSTYRVQFDAPYIDRLMFNGIIPLITAIVNAGTMIYVTVRIDWQLAVVAFAVSPFLLLLSHTYRGRMRTQWRAFKEHASSAMSVVQEALTAVRVVKAFGQEDREKDRFMRHSSASVGAYLRAALSESYYTLLVALITTLGTAIVLYVGAQHVRSGRLTVGTLLLVMSYLGQVYEPLKSIGNRVTLVQTDLASAERVYSLLDESPEIHETKNPRPLSRAVGAVSFRNVSFAYESERWVLAGVSFDIAAGMRVGIVGKTGAGKTTLVNLISRFYDPQRGQILLDNVDLRELRVADLRRQLAIVVQEPLLFSTSIAENIAYSRSDARPEQIIEAAKSADAHDFIAALPDGYETLVGERGMKLSGGERQRVALARAFLKDAPILILDEPTSSVDIKTEAQIMGAMQRLMQGRTTFVIAHRLTTIENCDLLLVLKNGRLTLQPSGLSGRDLRELVLAANPLPS